MPGFTRGSGWVYLGVIVFTMRICSCGDSDEKCSKLIPDMFFFFGKCSSAESPFFPKVDGDLIILPTISCLPFERSEVLMEILEPQVKKASDSPKLKG